MAITLDATTKSLELVTSSAASTDWSVSWVDMTTTAFTPGDGQGNVAGATTTTIAAAPAASTQRGVKAITVVNKSTTTAQTVTIQKDVSATNYSLFTATLQAGESLAWNDGGEWGVFDSTGRRKIVDPAVTGITGRNVPFYKTGTASDAAAYWYTYWKDAGFPGAWAPGTPGINGRVTDGMDAADTGCLPLWTPTGSLYLSSVNLTATVNHNFMLCDVVWVNSGIAVTTTGPQAITTPAFPARDLNGSANGEGYMIGLVFTAASTNAAVINTSTVSYTNSDGTAGRTATLVNVAGDMIPVTPVIGTCVWFRLAAGDKGVQSIESITLATSLVTGSVSLIVARPLATVTPTVVNIGTTDKYPDPGLRLYTGTCALWFAKSSATTATTINGSVVVVER